MVTREPLREALQGHAGPSDSAHSAVTHSPRRSQATYDWPLTSVRKQANELNEPSKSQGNVPASGGADRRTILRRRIMQTRGGPYWPLSSLDLISKLRMRLVFIPAYPAAASNPVPNMTSVTGSGTVLGSVVINDWPPLPAFR